MEAKQLRGIGLALVLLVVVPCAVVCAQISIQLPGSVQPGTYTGNSIDFGDVPIGTTKTATYRFGIQATSATAGSVTFIGFSGGYFKRPSFALTNLPSLPKNIAPGGSITFNVTFTPTTAQTYTNQFTITVSGGRPLRTQQQTVTLTGRGVAQQVGQQIDSSGQTYPQYDFTRLQTTINSTRQNVAALETKLDLAQQDTAKLETKLDTLWQAVENLRARLLALASALGELITGEAINLYPWGTELSEPVQPPQPSILDLLAKLEAKLDRFQLQPTEITIVEVYDVIIEINQLIVVLGGNVDKLETKLDNLYSGQFALARDIVRNQKKLDELLDDLDTMWGYMDDGFDRLNDAVAANAAAIRALQASNDRIEDKLNRLLGYPATPDDSLLTLTVTPKLESASDHSAILEGAAGTVEGGAVVTIYWLGKDNWIPGVTDPWYLDTVIANPDGSFSLTKDGWGSSWPRWCEITQTNVEGESVPVRVDLSTVMIEA